MLSSARIADGSRGLGRYRGSVAVSSTTCWNVGRLWNGNGGIEIPLATTQARRQRRDGLGERRV
jgi:hypothetical protein